MVYQGKRIAATIEARMGSSRLPGKMALELYPGLPALGAVIERLKRCKTLSEVVVATTTDRSDDILENIAHKYGAVCYRGSPDDVLGRVIGAGKTACADALALVTGDCSCISTKLIDEGVEFFTSHNYDLISNCLEDTYPVGIDLQVVRYDALVKAHDMALKPPYKSDSNNFEHTIFFIMNHPDIFSIYRYPAPKKYRRADIHLALDTQADLDVIRKIYACLYPKNEKFDLDDILRLLKEDPGIMKPIEGLNINRTGIKDV